MQTEETYPVVSRNADAQAEYVRSRDCGFSHQSAWNHAVVRRRRDIRGPLKPFDDGEQMIFGHVRYAVVSEDLEVQAHYEACRENGESHDFAQMLALRQFPGVTRTDSVFNSGRVNGNQFEGCPQIGDWYKAKAESAGVSTTGKFYCHQLADRPGDPTAWVGDRSDVVRVAREKGYRVSGLVDYEPPGFRDQQPKSDTPFTADRVRDEVDEVMAADPGQRRGDVEERLVQLRSGAIDPNPPLVRGENPSDHLVEW